MSRLISFAVLIAIIIVIGLMFYRVLIGFFIPVFLAAVLVVVFRPLHRWVLEKTGHRDQVAAVVTTLLIMLTILLPVGLVCTAAATQGLQVIQANDPDTLWVRVAVIRDRLGLTMPSYTTTLSIAEQEIQDIQTELTSSPSITTHEAATKLDRMAQVTRETLLTLQDLVLQDQVGAPAGVAYAATWRPLFDELIALTEAISEAAVLDAPRFTIVQPAVTLKTRFSDLKTSLLGGPVMSIARGMANPTSEKREEWTSSVLEFVQPRILSITGATGTFLIKLVFGAVILVVATFFFLYDGPAMLKTIMHLSPLDDAYEQELLLEFDRISRAVVVATLLSAVVQGLTAGLGYAVAGMNSLTLLIMLTTVFAMVPFVGPAVIWVPVALYIGLYEERYVAAILLAAWGVLVVGTIDNVVKAFVLHGQSQLHPLLALLSVLGGVQTLGPIGIVVGPMVVAMLQTLLSILQRELIHFDKTNLVLSTQGLAGAAVDETDSLAASRKISKRKSRHQDDAPAPDQDADEGNEDSDDS